MNYKTFKTLGTMSGTSLDGIDISIITTNGVDIFEFGPNYFSKFSKDLAKKLLYILNIKDELHLHKNFIKNLNLTFTKEYAHTILKIIRNLDVDLIGFHGQTIYHDPYKKKSIQLGDGQLISNILNKQVIFNFRKNDLLNNGQGAPLAPIYHKFIIEDLNLDLPSCILNIGGISNITYWDGKDLIGFDTGPGNSLINDLMLKFFNEDFDRNGEVAFSGKILNDLIRKLMKDEYFKINYPKSLDRQHFNHYFKNIPVGYKPEDLVASMTEFTALSISNAIVSLPNYPKEIIITGGGSKNLFIIQKLKKYLKCEIVQLDKSKYHPDFIESQLIGFLAARSINKIPFTYPLTTGVYKPISGGELRIPRETH